MDVVHKITINDIININRKDTDVLADVAKGDLVRVQLEEKKLFGIVVSVDDKSMELQTPEGQIRWVSRYVIYEKIQ